MTDATKALKDKIKELKEKRNDKIQEDTIKAAKDEIEEQLTFESFDVVKTGVKAYSLVTLKYDLESKKAYVSEVLPISNRVFGMSYLNRKKDLKSLFLNKRRKK